MLVNIHFQKYNRYKFLESYLYYIYIVTVLIAFQKFVTVILLKNY